MILKYTPDGTENTFATDLNVPQGLPFYRSGNLFVAETIQTGPGDILKFTPGVIETVLPLRFVQRAMAIRSSSRSSFFQLHARVQRLPQGRSSEILSPTIWKNAKRASVLIVETICETDDVVRARCGSVSTSKVKKAQSCAGEVSRSSRNKKPKTIDSFNLRLNREFVRSRRRLD